MAARASSNCSAGKFRTIDSIGKWPSACILPVCISADRHRERRGSAFALTGQRSHPDDALHELRDEHGWVRIAFDESGPRLGAVDLSGRIAVNIGYSTSAGLVKTHLIRDAASPSSYGSRLSVSVLIRSRKRNWERDDPLERCPRPGSRVSHRDHPSQVPNTFPRRPQDPVYPSRFNRIFSTESLRRVLNVAQERGGTTIKGVSGAVREGEVAPGRDEVDDDDGLDFEVQSGPDAVARSKKHSRVSSAMQNKTMAGAAPRTHAPNPTAPRPKTTTLLDSAGLSILSTAPALSLS